MITTRLVSNADLASLPVMAAEVVHYFLPKLVELHNYSPANSQAQKLDNWRTLNSEHAAATLYVNSTSGGHGLALLPGPILLILFDFCMEPGNEARPQPDQVTSTSNIASYPGLLSPAFVVLQATNAGVRRPGYKATSNVDGTVKCFSKQVS